jgi:DedD protein
MAEQDTSADADLQLKKRARRRLVGAIALALLAVIVLPMVMDREPRPVGPDIQIRIPSQDAGSLAAKVMPGKSSPLPAPEPKAVAEPVPESKPDPRPEPKAAESIAAASAVAAAKPVEKVLAKTADKPASAPKPAGKAPPAAKPADKPAEKAAAMPAADANGQWVVQLGAYKEAANVKLLLSKLKGVNVPAYTEKYDSPQGTRTRVRAGPFATQEAAEKARARIKIIGVDGPVAPK